MPASKSTYDLPSGATSLAVKEEHIEYGFIGKLQNLKYEYRDDIRDRATLEANFREKFEALNRVKLTDAEFARLLDEIVTPDVYTAAKTLRGINAFTRDDGTWVSAQEFRLPGDLQPGVYTLNTRVTTAQSAVSGNATFTIQ